MFVRARGSQYFDNAGVDNIVLIDGIVAIGYELATRNTGRDGGCGVGGGCLQKFQRDQLLEK